MDQDDPAGGVLPRWKLPQTLHGQLYLLADDRKRHRFDGDNLPLFGFALRAAMLTDLYLTGHIEDKEGKPHRSSLPTPEDPLLRAACVRIGSAGRKDWAQLIVEDEKKARAAVRDQLKAAGWLRVQRPRFGIIPTARLGLSDEDTVSGLAGQVTEALRNAIDGRQADPRPLAVGLLAVLGQMPTVFSFKESSRHREQIRELIFAAIAPIVGLQQAIETYYEDVGARLASGPLRGLPPG
jgi:Golgi phosphoprotein 3 (GPP34)